MADGVVEDLRTRTERLGAWAIPDQIALRHKIGLLGVTFAAIVPWVTRTTLTAELIFLLYVIVFAISWDVVSGYTGAFSFGHTFFYAIGGYTSAVLNIQHGVDPLISVPIGALLAAVGGAIIGTPTLRLEGPYFALITLIAPLGLLQVFVYFGGIFGGQDGIIESPDNFVGKTSDSSLVVDAFDTMILVDYYIALLLVVCVLAISWAITRSDAGVVFYAIRTDEDVTKSLGFNTARYKISIFVVSGFLGGLGGAMFVHSTAGLALPGLLLHISVMIDVIIMVIIGGMGTISGAVLGVVVFEVMERFIEWVSTEPIGFVIPGTERTLDDTMPVPAFIVAMLIVYYMPGGLVRKFVELGVDFRTEVRERDLEPDAEWYDRFGGRK